MPGASKKILILSASIGAGHNQAANAIKAAWEIKFPCDDIQIIDFMADESSRFNHFIKEAYLKTIAISPDLYDTLYRWTYDTGSGAKVQDILFWTMRTSMLRMIRQYRPDLVICTHPFPCGAAAYLKRRRKVIIPVVGIITDFAVHSLWIHNEVDQYIVASPEQKADLLRQGISTFRVFATGIPIHPRFADPRDSRMPDHLPDPVILLMGGGLGMGAMEEFLKELNRVALPLDIIAVTGENVLLRETMEAMAVKSPHRVRVLGYTKHIYNLMATADILITKPGALTISEALAAELPMLFFEAIPGQEIDNAGFAIRSGAARWLAVDPDDSGREGNSLSRQLTDLLAHPEELANMRAAAKRIGRSQSAFLAVNAMNRIFERTLAASEL